MKKRTCTIRVAKTKALICVFVFAYADCLFSDAAAHFGFGELVLLFMRVITIF